MIFNYVMHVLFKLKWKSYDARRESMYQTWYDQECMIQKPHHVRFWTVAKYDKRRYR